MVKMIRKLFEEVLLELKYSKWRTNWRTIQNFRLVQILKEDMMAKCMTKRFVLYLVVRGGYQWRNIPMWCYLRKTLSESSVTLRQSVEALLLRRGHKYSHGALSSCNWSFKTVLQIKTWFIPNFWVKIPRFPQVSQVGDIGYIFLSKNNEPDYKPNYCNEARSINKKIKKNFIQSKIFCLELPCYDALFKICFWTKHNFENVVLKRGLRQKGCLLP